MERANETQRAQSSQGQITAIKRVTTAHVKIDVGGQIVTDAITSEAVEDLARGQSVYALLATPFS